MEFDSLAGYASLRISSGQQSARSRFSFVFLIPGYGRIEVFDPLGRVRYQILIVNQTSYFVAPSKKAFWQGDDTEIMEKFMGFPLQLSEVISLLSGRWSENILETGTSGQKNWDLKRDQRGRIQQGSRNGFFFQVEGYFDPSPWIQSFVFHHQKTSGRVKVLDIHFDQPAVEGAFSTAFLESFSRITWEEMKKFLDDPS